MKFRHVLFSVGVLLWAVAAEAQARLTVVNQSERQMTVKVMQITEAGESLHTTTSVGSFKSQTVYFSQTGDYVLKTMAALAGRDSIYQKGSPFEVYNGRDGYSVMTVTFTIREAAVPQVLGGREISKQEFDRDSSGR